MVLLMPLFAVQDKLRAAAMGRPFWKTMAERQVVLGKRKVALADLMNEVSHRFSSVYQIVLIVVCSLLPLRSGS